MVKKIFVNSDLYASIPCPECGKSHRMDVSTFIGHKKEVRLKYTCKCGHQMPVLLERRRFIRKEKKFRGYLVVGNNRTHLVVTDLSKYGVQVKLLGNHYYKKDDVLNIEFTLDDPGRSKVTSQVRVKRIMPSGTLGCEFIGEDHYDDLGKYLLFHF